MSISRFEQEVKINGNCINRCEKRQNGVRVEQEDEIKEGVKWGGREHVEGGGLPGASTTQLWAALSLSHLEVRNTISSRTNPSSLCVWRKHFEHSWVAMPSSDMTGLYFLCKNKSMNNFYDSSRISSDMTTTVSLLHRRHGNFTNDELNSKYIIQNWSFNWFNSPQNKYSGFLFFVQFFGIPGRNPSNYGNPWNLGNPMMESLES